MQKVFIYSFEGSFNGKPEYEYTYPKVGDTHKCLLFVSQSNNELDIEKANSEIAYYGFENINNLRGNSFNVDALNTDLYRGFSGFYEEALQEGSSLVFYPNA